MKTLEQINREFYETLKTFEQINREFLETENLIKQRRKKSRRRTIRFAADILLYASIVFIFAAIIIFNGSPNKRANIFGYSGFTVLSKSMQSEIPEGAFILTKRVDPNNIKVGDDIAFIRKKDDAVVTHRVIYIYENYAGTGGKGFQTQGVDNAVPDQDIISGDDVIGVVKLTVPGLGFALNYIAVNVGLLFVILGGFAVITAVTKKLLLPDKKIKRGWEKI